MGIVETNFQVERVRARSAAGLPVTAIVPVRNEAHNLERCLEALRDVGEVYVVDSQSTDETCSIAASHGAKVVQFRYGGGWPKKRQWAMDNLPIANDWILLIDADEVLTEELGEEIRVAIQNRAIFGYHIRLEMYFLGKVLRHCDAGFWKLALFRKGHGHFECRLKEQDASMADMEVHEHVVVDGPSAKLHHPLTHRNVESLSRYIQKHNEYSNWEARVLAGEQNLSAKENEHEMRAAFSGTQAQRRRWLKRKLYRLPGSPILLFLYRYWFRLGFLDGTPGLIYCAFQAVQMFHTKAKIFELRNRELRNRRL
ncbi:MAG TPA: glycosyltransferase family 2 protein [Terriglobales bacterium]|nr:glycosyltransferase family 2 protein [Terriglobales bacterium]